MSTNEVSAVLELLQY